MKGDRGHATSSPIKWIASTLFLKHPEWLQQIISFSKVCTSFFLSGFKTWWELWNPFCWHVSHELGIRIDWFKQRMTRCYQRWRQWHAMFAFSLMWNSQGEWCFHTICSRINWNVQLNILLKLTESMFAKCIEHGIICMWK